MIDWNDSEHSRLSSMFGPVLSVGLLLTDGLHGSASLVATTRILVLKQDKTIISHKQDDNEIILKKDIFLNLLLRVRCIECLGLVLGRVVGNAWKSCSFRSKKLGRQILPTRLTQSSSNNVQRRHHLHVSNLCRD
jgi:hypothetical protein